MCGICGVFNYKSREPVDGELLQRMNATLRHRGPDDDGFVIRDGAGLAMRRLAIIDVAGGHQPIGNESGDVQVVLNGEIYNYPALREELLRKGHQLKTHSDTETIVHFYEEEGDKCVSRLDGMFAFALHDAPQRRLLIGRDRIGKKPVYYADVDGTLVFGSELKALLQHPKVSRELDPQAIDLYLAMKMIPAPYTIFKHVRKLPAGSILVCDRNGSRVETYWRHSDFLGHERFDAASSIEEIRALLFEAVRKRLISEVPLGAFLSGGIDSSVIVAIMARLSGGKPVKTFSIGFEGPQLFNELPYARALAKHYNTEHHETMARPDIVELLPHLVHHADEPFSDEASIPTYLLARAARKDVTVVLTGDGGDEVFAGYDLYQFEKWSRVYRRFPRALDSVFRAGASAFRANGPLRVFDRANRFARSSRGSAAAARLGWVATWTTDQRRAVMTADFNAGVNGSSPEEFLSSHTSGGSPLEQMLEIDTNVILPDQMLVKVDRMTMAASVEARCPLLDHHLMERVARISVDEKIPGSRKKDLKHILKMIAADLIPQDLLDRPKHGFNVPLNYWFRDGARDFARDILRPEEIRRRGVFEPRAVEAILDAHWSGRVNAGPQIYSLLVFEMWAREYMR